jgi:hypothetical protein
MGIVGQKYTRFQVALEVAAGDNKPGVYSRMKTMLLVLKVEMLAVFSFLTVNTSMARPLPGWFLPIVLTVVFGSVLCCVIDVCLYAKRKKR